MTFQHRSLAAGRWKRFSLAEQMANIGSEVERAISWKEKGNDVYSRRAFERALELLDLSISSTRNYHELRELTRLREVLVDYFIGENIYSSSKSLWHIYFQPFNYAARSHRSEPVRR